jgi:two-component system chemotaxis sensor kinase CheA
MFGFDDIAAFTHDVETVFDMVRDGRIPVTKELVDLTLSACDQIRRMVDGEEADAAKAREIVDRFREMIPDAEGPDEAEAVRDSECESSDPVPGNVTYRIRFRPCLDILATGTNPLLLLDELRELGECAVTARIDAIPELKDLDPEQCYFYWDVILTTREGINAIKDVFIFVEDACELTIEAIDDGGSLEDGSNYKRLGEILTERGDVSSDDLKRGLKNQKRIGEVLVEAEALGQEAVKSALVEQQRVREVRKERQSLASASSIRVPADKLDKLVDLVGELVTVQASLSQKASRQNDPGLVLIAEEVERLTAELRNNTMGIRMLPIGTTFSKFKRLVRDLSKELGKEIVLTTDGGETELDKTVIERLDDPMVHIIRNSIDHGIELPDVREEAGKPRQGTIHLSAAHSGAHVLIRISDDGSGLDEAAIRTKAVERGLIALDAEMSKAETYSLIFAPGFSTAEKVTDVSGRGVGMDVVKKSIEELRGSVEINSEKGSGTTITLKLPLTLAIIDCHFLRWRSAWSWPVMTWKGSKAGTWQTCGVRWSRISPCVSCSEWKMSRP